MSDNGFDVGKLLEEPDRHRPVIRAKLTPIAGDRFQPAAFGNRSRDIQSPATGSNYGGCLYR